MILFHSVLRFALRGVLLFIFVEGKIQSTGTKLMGLMADLGRGPVRVDAAIFISFIEEHPKFLPLLRPLFGADSVGSVGYSLPLWRSSPGRTL